METNDEMKSLHCPFCGGTEFDQKRRLTNTLYSPGGFFGMVTGLRIQVQACLNCGFVAQFVEVDKLRKMARKDIGS